MLFHLFACAFILYQLVRFLRLLESCSAPTLHYCESKFAEKVLHKCPSLNQVYKPPAIWGKCGHIQTAIYGKLGRRNAPRPSGKRFYITMATQETITYDVFQPTNEHKLGGDYTILVCPGIANSSEKAYVRTFINFAMGEGFRVIVLNHIGSLPNVKLTSPKIFTYGDTKYFAAMIKAVKKAYRDTSWLMLGYSMGGNIVMKYLGENVEHQNNILCAVSLCQGYDAVRSTEPMKLGFRRLYNLMITMNLKKIIQPHWDELFTPSGDNLRQKPAFDEDRVKSAKCLFDIEDGLLRRFDGHKSVHEYMDKASCCHVMDNVRIPVLLVNTEDDPVVVNDIHDIPKAHSESNPQAIFATYKFGGHLGYYTGPWYKPDEITLVEKLIVEYLNSIIELRHQKPHKE